MTTHWRRSKQMPPRTPPRQSSTTSDLIDRSATDGDGLSRAPAATSAAGRPVGEFCVGDADGSESRYWRTRCPRRAVAVAVTSAFPSAGLGLDGGVGRAALGGLTLATLAGSGVFAAGIVG